MSTLIISKENSRYKAFKSSLAKMQKYGSLLDLYNDLGNPGQLLLGEELKERFVYTDFKVMRIAL